MQTWGTDADSPASFVGWLAQALELHARRSPQLRSELAAAGERHPALVSVTRKSFNKKHDLPASAIESVEGALVADRQELGRMLARSAFAQEAVIAAARRPAGGWAATSLRGTLGRGGREWRHECRL